jgi:hypothetical protein
MLYRCIQIHPDTRKPARGGLLGVFPVMLEHVETSIWWSRGDLNPRPPVLRFRDYMLSRVY